MKEGKEELERKFGKNELEREKGNKIQRPKVFEDELKSYGALIRSKTLVN